MWWHIDDVECLNCGKPMWFEGYYNPWTKKMSSKKKTEIMHKMKSRNAAVKKDHPKTELVEDVDPEHSNCILWCKKCGTLCIVNRYDPISISDYKTPQLVPSRF